MNSKNTSISENLRFLREKKGYSQEYMSDMLNVSQQTYSNYEKYPEKASLAKVMEIANILEVKISFLLNEDDSFVINSINQQGGQAISLFQSNSDNIVINQLKNEIDWLRSLVVHSKQVNG